MPELLLLVRRVDDAEPGVELGLALAGRGVSVSILVGSQPGEAPVIADRPVSRLLAAGVRIHRGERAEEDGRPAGEEMDAVTRLLSASRVKTIVTTYPDGARAAREAIAGLGLERLLLGVALVRVPRREAASFHFCDAIVAVAGAAASLRADGYPPARLEELDVREPEVAAAAAAAVERRLPPDRPRRHSATMVALRPDAQLRGPAGAEGAPVAGTEPAESSVATDPRAPLPHAEFAAGEDDAVFGLDHGGAALEEALETGSASIVDLLPDRGATVIPGLAELDRPRTREASWSMPALLETAGDASPLVALARAGAADGGVALPCSVFALALEPSVPSASDPYGWEATCLDASPSGREACFPGTSSGPGEEVERADEFEASDGRALATAIALAVAPAAGEEAADDPYAEIEEGQEAESEPSPATVEAASPATEAVGSEEPIAAAEGSEAADAGLRIPPVIPMEEVWRQVRRLHAVKKAAQHPDAEEAARLHREAREDMERDAPDDAIPRLRRAVELRPAILEYRVLLGEALGQDPRRLEAAKSELFAAIALRPTSSAPYRALGLACSLAGELADAERFFTEALALDPEDPVARRELIRCRSPLERPRRLLLRLVGRGR